MTDWVAPIFNRGRKNASYSSAVGTMHCKIALIDSTTAFKKKR